MRSLTILVFATLAYWALRAVLQWLLQRGKRPASSPPGSGDEMVLDPQCRTYILKEGALPLRTGGETVYFCGEACASAYKLEHRS